MRKADVRTHRLGYGSQSVPALNVKVYNLGLDIAEIEKQFQCDASTAERALGFAFDSAQQEFWEGIQEIAEDIFGTGHKVYSEGRSAGWLYVDGLAPLETWNGRDLAKWAKLARLVRDDIKYRTSREALLDAITVNEWAKPGAELYNFVETPQGTRSLADMKAEAIKAGFGPVIRKG